MLLVVGDQDDAGFREPAAALANALRQRYPDEARAKLVTVEGMGHALAEEPGTDAAPQTTHAAIADRHAVDWFQRHLLEGL